MDKLTPTMEAYLDTICELCVSADGARVTDIALRMGVSKASTSRAMAQLADKGLIEQKRYQNVYLTPLGEAQAAAVNKRHTILLKFFIHHLHVSPAVADADACAIEHVISDETVQAMLQHLLRTTE